MGSAPVVAGPARRESSNWRGVPGMRRASPTKCRRSGSVRVPLFAVSVGPHCADGDEASPLLRSLVEAVDKDAALATAERAYRRFYPRAGKLMTEVARVRRP
jgi:hypothetical protein